MWLWRNRILIVLLCAISVSCGFVDLRPIGIQIEPGRSDSLLPDAYSPVIVSFDTAMEKIEAEGILQISSDRGMVSGDRFWKGDNLYFVPIQGWTAGVRYTLSLSGIIRSIDGRELRIERFISFYAINKSAPPLLEWYSPANGQSVGATDTVIELRFSCSMNRLSVEAALVIDGMGNKIFEWSAEDKILRIIPEKNLSAWTVYRWTLKDSAKSCNGVPLPKAISAQFITNLDQLIPCVANVYPVLYSGGLWLPTGADIETGLGPGHGIAIEFNKAMGENVLRSVRFEPSLAGRTELLSEKTIIHIFNRDPDPETVFTLIVSGDARDSEGLKIGEDYRISFVPDIPFLEILSFGINGVSVLANPGDDSAHTVAVDPAAGDFFLTIRFSLPFGQEEKQNAALKISLSPFFPKNLPPVALRSVSWLSDDRLFMTWECLKAGSANEIHYYKLLIPGGKGGISSGEGFYLKEDQFLYLEAVN
jgi:hypothetical protein